jgi:hypothetical protein
MTLILLNGVNKKKQFFAIISTLIRIFTAWNLDEGGLRSVRPENSCVSGSNRTAAYK